MEFRVLKIIAGALLLATIQVVLPIFPYEISFQHVVPLFVSDLVLLLVLSIYLFNTPKSNLIVQILIVYYIPGCLSILVESYLFKVTDTNLTLLGLMQGLVNTLFILLILKYSLYNHHSSVTHSEYQQRSAASWAGRVTVGIFLYVLLYFIAGILLQTFYPQLNEFYQGKIPSVDVIFYTQLIRGSLFVLIAIWFARHCTLGRIQKALLLGAIFSIVGGFSPLLAPNDLMPASIRIAHGVEVCTSNFIYGFCLALLFNKSKQMVSDTELV